MTNDNRFFTNQDGQTLLERFQNTIRQTKNFDVLVGYFFVSGFYKLSEVLNETEQIRILIGMSTNHETYELIEEAQQQISFESHAEVKNKVESNVTEELNNSHDKEEVEDGIQKFIKWIKSGKLIIRAYNESQIHAKVYIMKMKDNQLDKGRVITGSSNFTAAGLVDNIEFNVELKDVGDYEFAQRKFEELWDKSVDVTEVYIDTIENKTWINSNITPYEQYLKFLYEFFKEDLNYNPDLFYRNFPEGFKKLKYQEQAVINAKKILDKYNGVFISDVVGLGKTYIAAMLASQLKGTSLVIASPALISEDNPHSWPNVFREFKVVAITESIGMLQRVIERGTDRYENVFIDESHKFRNELTQSYELLAQICKNKKVILVSATPYNNTTKDILSQLKLFQNAKNSDVPGMQNLEQQFSALDKKLKGLDRLKNYDEYMKIVEENAKIIRNKVLRYLMVRRTRQDIRKFYSQDLKKGGNDSIEFPDIQKPTAVFYKMDEQLDRIFMLTLKLITYKHRFTYARYMPMLYLKDELKEFERTSQKNMGRFMKTLLVKRLESSFYAFMQTIERFIKSYQNFISTFEKGAVFVSKSYSNKIIEYYLMDNDKMVQQLIDNEKAERWESQDFEPQLLIDLKRDLNTLNCIKKLWDNINSDPKFDEFLNYLKNQSILKENKILIFTESVDTAKYLKRKLENNKFNDVLVYHGEDKKEKLKTVLSNFDPNNKIIEDKYRILVTTDILAEGVNLHRSNVVINYDIPWNPTRMIQRVGRINRVDTRFKQIYSFNFFPTIQSNEEIKLKEAAEAKIRAFIELLGNDAQLLTENEAIKSHTIWEKLNSNIENAEEEIEETSDLDYFTVIQKVQKENPDLFDKIKKLPQKARVARNYFDNEMKDDYLLTYFKKGVLDKYFLSSEEFAKELDFLEAADLFEAEPEEKPTKLNTQKFFRLLQKNKDELNRSLSETEEVEATKGGKDYGIRILKILRSKEFRTFKQFSENDSSYLAKVIDRIQDGAIPRLTLKKIMDAIKDDSNPGIILVKIREKLPITFLQHVEEDKKKESNIKKQVILSELFVLGK